MRPAEVAEKKEPPELFRAAHLGDNEHHHALDCIYEAA
jgi:hypothetical protein